MTVQRVVPVAQAAEEVRPIRLIQSVGSPLLRRVWGHIIGPLDVAVSEAPRLGIGTPPGLVRASPLHKGAGRCDGFRLCWRGVHESVLVQLPGTCGAKRGPGACTDVEPGTFGPSQPVVQTPRRTETAEAPGSQGATTENMGNISGRSNAASRDASAVECSGGCTTGCQCALSTSRYGAPPERLGFGMVGFRYRPTKVVTQGTPLECADLPCTAQDATWRQDCTPVSPPPDMKRQSATRRRLRG